MYKFMQKYNKKLLAVVMVFLMIAFVIPQFSKQPTLEDRVYATAGGENISAQDVQRSRYDWEILKGGDPRSRIPGLVIQNFDPQTRQPETRGLASALQMQAVSEIDKHPAMFLLLQREATKNGITVSEKDVDSLLGEVQVRLADRVVLYDNIKTQEIGDQVRQAARAFMLVMSSFEQATNKIKVSQPLLNNRMAKKLQEIKLQLVEFNDKDYADKVPAPSTEQIQEQFNKYADVLPGQVDPKTNAFGFGYKYPDRVKIGWIGISRDEVKKAIRATKTDYDWDVEAQRYYKKNGYLYATTQPSTQPSSQPSTQATTQASAQASAATSQPSTKPTTRPFAEVRDQILEAIITPEADKLETQIQSRVTQIMRDDWNAYHAATKSDPSTQPANAPKSSMGVPYNSPDYLSKLAEAIQNQFKVVLTVVTRGDKFMDKTELAELPGIGKSNSMFAQQFLPFNIYAIELAEPFSKDKPQMAIAPLRLFEPSRPTDDFLGTTYIFRLIDAEKSHKPADAREVLHKVEEDIRTAGAYELAKADAMKVLDATKSSDLRTAAVSAGKSITSPSYISSEGQLPSDVPVSALSQQAFAEEAFKLLSAAANNRSTIELIGLPRDYKVFVAQLADVRRIPMFANQVIEPQVALQVRSELARDLFDQWYRWDSVQQRMNYVDANKKKDSEG